MKKIKYLLLLSLLTLSLQANDGQVYIKAMELGLKQVANIPAMMKSYVMVEMKNPFGDPETDLKQEIEEFEAYQKELEKLPLDAKMKEHIAKRKEGWKKVLEVLGRPTKSQADFKAFKKYARPLREDIRKMIRASREKASGKYCDSIYYSGKLAANTQKFASLYMLLNWGDVNKEKLIKDMAKQKDMFGSSLAKLKEIVAGDPDLQKTIKTLEKDFSYFDFLQTSTSTFKPSLIYRKTNQMFKHSNDMVKKLLTRQK